MVEADDDDVDDAGRCDGDGGGSGDGVRGCVCGGSSGSVVPVAAEEAPRFAGKAQAAAPPRMSRSETRNPPSPTRPSSRQKSSKSGKPRHQRGETPPSHGETPPHCVTSRDHVTRSSASRRPSGPEVAGSSCLRPAGRGTGRFRSSCVHTARPRPCPSRLARSRCVTRRENSSTDVN